MSGLIVVVCCWSAAAITLDCTGGQCLISANSSPAAQLLLIYSRDTPILSIPWHIWDRKSKNNNRQHVSGAAAATDLPAPALLILCSSTWTRTASTCSSIFLMANSTGCPAKLFPLGYLLLCRILLMQIAKVWRFLKNSGNLLHDRHKNFENRFRNNWDNLGQSCHS